MGMPPPAYLMFNRHVAVVAVAVFQMRGPEMTQNVLVSRPVLQTTFICFTTVSVALEVSQGLLGISNMLLCLPKCFLCWREWRLLSCGRMSWEIIYCNILSARGWLLSAPSTSSGPTLSDVAIHPNSVHSLISPSPLRL